MRKTNVLVVMMLMLVFSISNVFAATPAETKEKPAITKTADTTAAQAPMVTAADAVNINTADAAGLVKIKGIGPKKADAIIAYRKENGNFKNIEELKKVKGIGPKIFEKIKSHITI
jgi:competence protein ComEA